MPQFAARRLVSVPPDVAFEVAADVARYRDFLPLLDASEIVGPVQGDEVRKTFKARLSVAYPRLGLKESFVSDVMVDRAARIVESVSADGPFKLVRTLWTIQQSLGRSEVSISIDYALRNALVQMALASAMESAVNKIMVAFEARAIAVWKSALSP